MKRKTCPTPTKRSYRDEIAAKLSMSNIAHYGEQRDRMPVRAYQCECGRWHLTSKR